MTNNILKFIAAILLFAAWAGAIAAKHTWPDIDINAFVLAITSTLMGLGVYHVKAQKS